MDNILGLITLHKAGFSHADFKKISSEEKNFGLLYTEILEKKRGKFLWMTDEKWGRIEENISRISPASLEKILTEKNIQVIPIESDNYPEKLKTIKQAPYILYTRGNLREEKKMIGVVGSRKNTTYGKKVLESIIPELVQSGCGIVSGGAFGIDALSHEITLASGGYTISVFGCSVDMYYPAQNTLLFDTILEKGGAFVSIFPLGSRAEPYMFPVRNEIVAALSDGIVIPEAGRKSGTLITAGLALEHGRDVFVVPGDIFRETSEGCNELISKGEGKCVTSAKEILEEYFPQVHMEKLSLLSEKIFDTEEKRIIYNALSEGYNTPDSIGENTNLTIDTIIMTLALLEIDGYIQLSNGGKYEIIC